MEFKKLLEDLKNTKLVRVTGSYADGTQNENSDIDFYIKPDHPDYKFREDRRHIEVIKEILDKYNVSMQSDMIGYWYSHKSENNLPIQIEFSDLFYKRPNKLPEVEIMGINFKTH
jgi:predicted nucleotidyltransferase